MNMRLIVLVACALGGWTAGSAYKNAVFRSDDDKKPKGYIPRDVAEPLLGRALTGTVWFTREESQRMREHPEWRDTEPPSAVTGDVCDA